MASRIDRVSGIDILKIVACLFVISLHFTASFYSNSPSNIDYILLHSFRWLTFSCVSLFMIITGYLNYNRSLDKGYIKRFFAFIITFFVYCIITMLINNPMVEDSIFKYLYHNFRYYFINMNSYFWYVNFYLSFYFIIPFLSIINNNINKKQHLFLIILLLTLICIPNTILYFGNIFDFIRNLEVTGLDFFKTGSFCFLYYFIGSYIRKYKNNKLNIRNEIILIILLVLSIVIHSYLDLVYLNKYQDLLEIGQHIYTFNEYGNIFTIVTGTAVFLLIKNIDLKNLNIKSGLKYIGSLSFEMYLGLIVADRSVDRVVEMFNITLEMNAFSYLIWTFTEFITVLAIAVIFNFIKKLVLKFINYIKTKGANYEKKAKAKK